MDGYSFLGVKKIPKRTGSGPGCLGQRKSCFKKITKEHVTHELCLATTTATFKSHKLMEVEPFSPFGIEKGGTEMIGGRVYTLSFLSQGSPKKNIVSKKKERQHRATP